MCNIGKTELVKFQVTPRFDFEVLKSLEPRTIHCVQVQFKFLIRTKPENGVSLSVSEQEMMKQPPPGW
jgi:hypothetical protein